MFYPVKSLSGLPVPAQFFIMAGCIGLVIVAECCPHLVENLVMHLEQGEGRDEEAEAEDPNRGQASSWSLCCQWVRSRVVPVRQGEGPPARVQPEAPVQVQPQAQVSAQAQAQAYPPHQYPA